MGQQFTIRDSIPIAQLEAYLRKWEKSGYASVYSIGESGGWPIWCAELTDRRVPAEEKEVAILMAQHSGMEVTGMTTLLSVGNYLAALDEKAREILAKQIVLIVPCPNCYGYAKQDHAFQFTNAAGVDEYTAMNQDMTVDPQKAPAAAALQALVEQWKPELIVDVHGVWYNEQTVIEITGGMSFASLNRTYDRGFVDAMNAAAEDAGYAILSEDFLQTLPPTDPICMEPKYRARFRGGVDKMLLGTSAYIKYHTMALNMEVAFEESGFLRTLKALELGIRGFPVRTMAAPLGNHSVQVGGSNAAQRRESRLELWNQKERLGTALLYPENQYVAGLLVTTNNEALDRVLGQEQCSIDLLCRNLEQEGYAMAGMKEDLSGGLPVYLAPMGRGSGEPAELEQGITLRLGLVQPDAVPRHVWLNGKELTSGEYQLLRQKNWTYVDVTIPAGQMPEIMLAVVSYDSTRKPMGILEFEGGSNHD